MTHISPRFWCPLLIPAMLLSAIGCGPDFQASANRLRAQNITQQNQIGDLQAKLAARDSTIKGLQSQLDDHSPRIQTLPNDRLAQLFTVGRIDVSIDTGITDLNEKGLLGFRVYLRTRTDDGMIFPATGKLTLEAFSLTAVPAEPLRIGTWTFSPEDMKKNWYSGFGLNHFGFNCPITSPVGMTDIVIRATFVDALTGRTLEATFTKKFELTHWR